jgi:hypothetical protein
MKTVTISITAQQAQRLLQRMQNGDVMLNFKQTGMKGGFWGAIASTLLPMALPLVAQGVGALVKKISGGSHPLTLTCTKCQMDKIKQCGAGGGLRINFKIKSTGRNPSPGTIQAMQEMHGSGLLSNLKGVIPMLLKYAKPLGAAARAAALSGAKSLFKAGISKASEKASEKMGAWGADLLESRFSSSKHRQGPEHDQFDLSQFPSAPSNTSWGPGLFPPQDGNGLRLSGNGLQLSGHGKGKKKGPEVPRRFVIKRV